MIKLSRAVVERMVLLCLYMKNREYKAHQLLEEALGIHNKKFRQDVVLQEIYRGEGLTREQSDWDYLLDQMVEQLQAANGNHPEGHHPALIDTIVNILQSPNSRSVLAGRTLQTLRRAVLLPDEMAKVGEAVQKELHCTGCGKGLVSGEMLSFVGTPEEFGFYCTRCYAPTSVACRMTGDCDGGSPVDGKLLGKAMGTKPDCGAHSPVEAKVPPANVENQPRDHIVEWAEIGRGLRGAQLNFVNENAPPGGIIREPAPEDRDLPRFIRRPARRDR